MAEDIVGLLDHLEIGKAAIIGHSLGGMVAYHLAANHQERNAPDRRVRLPSPLQR